MTTTQDIVQKLWSLCHILRDDGIKYLEYVTELTFLLFLKMAKETEVEEQLPEGYRWSDLESLDGIEQLDFYKKMLIHLGTHGSQRVQDIFTDAQTSLRKPKNLKKLTEDIDKLDWYSARHEGLGDMYEGLLEKNANETKSGAGQYFTPRPLIEAMVECLKPQPGETIQDPALGTGGFLRAADSYIKANTDELFDLNERQQQFQRRKALIGIELVPDVRRLAQMNLMLRGIDCDILIGDTLSPLGAELPKADVILTNPPFGTKKGGGRPTRDDFTYVTSNKQLAFLQHIYRGLKPGGRAAVVLPDNVLFEDNTGQKIRADLMDKCNLHTVLRLPTGIFYAQGVKTNVLFFQRGPAGKETGNTKAVWFFDLRTNMPSFGKRTPFGLEHLKPFLDAYGEDPNGGSRRKDEGEDGRFRKFTRKEISERSESLDVRWLRDDSEGRTEDLPDPDGIAAEILLQLQNATEEIQALVESLSSDDNDAGMRVSS
ncbi:MAG: type I restriction-modification system subunit M [Planctomycetes bacterium]|nr:type I restriction-modification system subunit M [Planctomycetota bacterium]